MKINNVRYIAFDADDTLWENEDKYRASEAKFYEIMQPYASKDEADKLLYSTEAKNIPVWGYGLKSFVISMLETARELSKGKVTSDEVEMILDIARSQNSSEVIVMQGVENVLKQLSSIYKLILITKGDSHEQEAKIVQSGLKNYFTYTRVVSDKNPAVYHQICKDYNIDPEEFIMVGNSLKSDVNPALEIGGVGIYIPYHITWAHEVVDEPSLSDSYLKLDSIKDLPKIFGV